MPRGSSPKRVRQYEHVKESAQERGVGEDRAEEIAARTVGEEHARAGEPRTASRTPLGGVPSSRRGGQGAHPGGTGPTRDQLYEEAKRKDVKGRSAMTKAELARAVGH
ncbi:plasmid stabilization protein [Streptomyces sp. NPDC001743]|uniref:plasmid stabilization protein n=1 Tax=Streptomyces sp. NPDC001743 TaxID=3154397 RepID=UPI00332F8668